MRDYIQIFLFVVVFPWLVMIVAIPYVAAIFFRAFSNQLIGYSIAVILYAMFLVMWYKLARILTWRNIHIHYGD